MRLYHVLLGFHVFPGVGAVNLFPFDQPSAAGTEGYVHHDTAFDPLLCPQTG